MRENYLRNNFLRKNKHKDDEMFFVIDFCEILSRFT